MTVTNTKFEEFLPYFAKAQNQNIHCRVLIFSYAPESVGRVGTIDKSGCQLIYVKQLIIWDLKNGGVLHKVRAHTWAVQAVSITPDGKRAISVSKDKTCVVWDMTDGSNLCTLKGHNDFVESASITPDGKCAITGSRDRNCIIWNLRTGEKIKELRGHTWSVNKVTLSPDGRFAMTGSGDTTCIYWDLKHGNISRRIKGHSNWINVVAFSHDGTRVVTGSDDGTLILWNMATGCRSALLVMPATALTASFLSNKIFLCCGSGEILYLEAEKNLSGPLFDIATVRQIWDFESNKLTEPLVFCPLCGNCFPAHFLVLDKINEIKRKVGLRPDQSPCLDLPDEAWEDPGLLGSCPKCGADLKFNPFIAGGDD